MTANPGAGKSPRASTSAKTAAHDSAAGPAWAGAVGGRGAGVGRAGTVRRVEVGAGVVVGIEAGAEDVMDLELASTEVGVVARAAGRTLLETSLVAVGAIGGIGGTCDAPSAGTPRAAGRTRVPQPASRTTEQTTITAVTRRWRGPERPSGSPRGNSIGAADYWTATGGVHSLWFQTGQRARWLTPQARLTFYTGKGRSGRTIPLAARLDIWRDLRRWESGAEAVSNSGLSPSLATRRLSPVEAAGSTTAWQELEPAR
jgi:hypothetical protein